MNRLVACLFIFSAACSSNPSLDDFTSQQIAIECEFAVRCCASVAGAQSFASVAACEQQLAQPAQLAAAKTQIAAGITTYDSAEAGSCLSQTKSIYASCTNAPATSVWLAAQDACAAAIQGAKKTGATCNPDATAYYECASDAFCKQTGFMTGVCTPYGAAGDACSGPDLIQPNDFTGSADCKIGNYCDSMTMQCAAQKAQGAACSTNAECQSFSCDETTSTCAAATALAVTTLCPTQQP